MLKEMIRGLGRVVSDNRAGILTGLGAAGAITTAIMTGRASYKAALLIEGVGGVADTKEGVQLVWREYVPAAITGVATVGAIIAANRVGARRAAAFTAAFKLSEEMSERYRDKVVEVVGRKTEEKVRAGVAEDRIARNPPPESTVILVSGSDVLFYDDYSDRYFKSDMESVRQAINEINHQINNCFYASLTDFYDKLGLDKTGISDELGWNSDELLEVDFAAVMYKNKPAISISFNKTPINGYNRVH